jgi:hypothetical protein
MCAACSQNIRASKNVEIFVLSFWKRKRSAGQDGWFAEVSKTPRYALLHVLVFASQKTRTATYAVFAEELEKLATTSNHECHYRICTFRNITAWSIHDRVRVKGGI